MNKKTPLLLGAFFFFNKGCMLKGQGYISEFQGLIIKRSGMQTILYQKNEKDQEQAKPMYKI